MEFSMWMIVFREEEVSFEKRQMTLVITIYILP